MYDREKGPKLYSVTGGIRHGFIPGPLLLNIMYDVLLKLQIPRAIKHVTFGVNIVLIIVKKYLQYIQNLSRVTDTGYFE